MNAKVYSTFFTVNGLLGLLGASIASGVLALMTFSRGSVGGALVLLSLSSALVILANRACFPKEEEIASASVSQVSVVGGPLLYLCVLKMNGKWRWFSFGPGARNAFERAFSIDV